MYRKIIVAFILAIVLFCCGLSDIALGSNNPSGIKKANKSWLRVYNRNINEIGRQYTDQAILFLEDGALIRGMDAINRYYSDKRPDFGKIESIHTVTRFEIAPDYTFYEIGYFLTAKKDCYQYFVIWQNVNKLWLRQFEIIIEKQTVAKGLTAIENARKQWLSLYREYNPRILADTLYTANATFDHVGIITQGIQDISATYLTKATPDYELDLVPQWVTPVNDNFVFEIGRYSGSYSGSYMFLWRKQPDGAWKIMLDVTPEPADTH